MALSLTVTARRHRQGTAAVLAQVMDATSPGQLAIIPGSFTVNPTTFSATALFTQSQAGQLLLSSAGPTYSQSFTAQTSVTITNATHGLGTQDLFVQLYDTAGQALDPAGLVTVHPTTFLVTLTFLQDQSGTVVLSAPTPSFAAAFTVQTSFTVASGTHGLGTANLLWQVWDDATPRLLIHPGSVTLNSSTLGVTFAFAQEQSGRYVLAAPTTMAVVPFSITTGALLSAAGGVAALGGPVASSLRAGSGTLSGVAVRLASSVRAGAGTVSGVGNRIAGSVRAGSGSFQATRIAATSSLRASTGTTQATSSRIQSTVRAASGNLASTSSRVASSLRAAVGQQAGVATRIASSVRPSTGTMHGQSSSASTAVRAAPGSMQATTARATSSLRAAVGQTAGVGNRIASSLRVGAGMLQATRAGVASSLRPSPATMHGQAALVNHPTRSGVGQHAGVAAQLASSLRAATGHMSALGGSTPTAAGVGTGRMMGHPVLVATASGQPQITIRVPGTTHQTGSAALTVDTYDAVTLLQWGIPGSVTIHPTLFDVTVTILDGRSTLVMIMPLPSPYVLPFTNQTTLTIPGATHGLGSADLLWQCVDTGTPGQVIRPGSITVHPSTFQAQVTFAQPQSGTFTLSRGLPAFVQAFTAQTSLAITAGTHGLGIQGVRTTIWDTGTPRALVLPGSLVLAANGTVTLGFLQPQSGSAVLSASPPIFRTLFDSASGQLRASAGQMQATSARVTTQLLARTGVMNADAQVIASAGPLLAARMTGRAYVVAREPAGGVMTLLMPGLTHGMSTPALLYQCYDTTSGLQAVDADLGTIDATTGELRLTWGQPLLGAVILYEAPAPYLASFTNTTQLIVTGPTHGLGTATLLWQLRDTQTPAQIILPDRVLVNTSSLQVIFQFGQTQSGTVLLTTGTPTAAQGFTAQTSVVFPGSSHLLGTPYLLWRATDAAGVTVEDFLAGETFAVSTTAPYTATLILGQAESGTLILSAPSTRLLVLLAPPGSASVIATGGMRGDETTVASSLRAGAGRNAALAGPIAHAILSRTTGIQGVATRLASSLRASTGGAHGVRAAQTSSLKAGAGTDHATAVRLTSSLRAALGTLTATTSRATSSLRSSVGRMQGQGLPLPPGAATGQGHAQGVGGRIASNLLTGAGQAQASTARLTTGVRASTGTLAGLSVRAPQSLRSGAGQEHGSRTSIASSVRAAPGHLSAIAGVLVPGGIGAHGDMHGHATLLASSLRAGAGQMHGAAAVQTTSLQNRTGTAQAVALRVANSLLGRAALVHGVAALLSHTLRNVVGTQHGAAVPINATPRAGVGQFASSRVTLVPTSLLPTALGRLQGLSARATSSVRGSSGQQQALSARVLSALRGAAGHDSASAARVSSSLILATGQMHIASNRASTLALTAHVAAVALVASGAFVSGSGYIAGVPSLTVGTPAGGSGTLQAIALHGVSQLRMATGQAHATVALIARPRDVTGALGSGRAGVVQMSYGRALRFRGS